MALLFLLCAAASLGAANSLFAQTSTTEEDLAACPGRVGLVFTSPHSGRTYAGGALRGGTDSYFGRVYYGFGRVEDESRTWVASGTFWVYGLECRIGFLGYIIPPMSRLEFAEWLKSDANGCSGGGGGAADNVGEHAYDPYEPYTPGSGAGGCGWTGGGGGGCAEGPVEDHCRAEYIVIEISHDGGVTWSVFWEGYATVCG